ncbi:MAG: hypothetical protein BJ554DRAFT_145, partial [Olpidium bornovanus]
GPGAERCSRRQPAATAAPTAVAKRTPAAAPSTGAAQQAEEEGRGGCAAAAAAALAPAVASTATAGRGGPPAAVRYRGVSVPESSRDDAGCARDGHYIVVPNEYITLRYRIIKLLGQGTFGRVVQCWDEHTHSYVAIKIIRAVPKYREASQTEIRVLNRLREHDPTNVKRCIHLRDCFDFQNHVCMTFDLLGESVFDFLKSNGFKAFPPHHIQHMAYQLMVSVAFVHDLGLIHTDLKPENILLLDGRHKAHPPPPSRTRARTHTRTHTRSPPRARSKAGQDQKSSVPHRHPTDRFWLGHVSGRVPPVGGFDPALPRARDHPGKRLVVPLRPVVHRLHPHRALHRQRPVPDARQPRTPRDDGSRPRKNPGIDDPDRRVRAGARRREEVHASSFPLPFVPAFPPLSPHFMRQQVCKKPSFRSSSLTLRRLPGRSLSLHLLFPFSSRHGAKYFRYGQLNYPSEETSRGSRKAVRSMRLLQPGRADDELLQTIPGPPPPAAEVRPRRADNRAGGAVPRILPDPRRPAWKRYTRRRRRRFS